MNKASLLLAQLPAEDARRILQRIDPAHRQQLDPARLPRPGAPGVSEPARRVVREFLDRASGPAAPPAELLEALTPAEIASMLMGEWPVTVAALLDLLPPARRAEVLQAMPEPLRQRAEAAARRGTMPEALAELIVRRLLSRLPAAGDDRQEEGRHHGQRQVTIDRGEAEGDQTALERDFCRLAQFDRAQLAALLEQVPLAELAVAFIGSPVAVRQRILEHLSAQERQLLRQHLRMLGPVRPERTRRQRERLAVHVWRLLQGHGTNHASRR